MTRMHSPPHPGAVLKEYLGDTSLSETAERLGVTRVMPARILSGASAVSVEMAQRLADAYGTSPELWTGMQLQYDLHQAGTRPRQ